MLYIALTFWLVVIVLTAWGVRELWGGMIKPKIINTILLPGTLVAQVGHVLGLLVTGATVSNTSLYKGDESGEPATTTNPKPRIPIIGPIVIAMLPLVACATAIFFLAHAVGQPFLAHFRSAALATTMPTKLSGVFHLLREQIELVERLTRATLEANFSDWGTWLFVYLFVCLAVRTAPLPGNLRGSLGAILLLGVGAAFISRLLEVADPRIEYGWAVLSLTVATLLSLLIVSLLIRGVVGLVTLLRSNA